MKNKKSLFFSIFVLLSFFSIAIIKTSNATANYEWLQNRGFESNINYIEDNGAESGNLTSGVQYGNFSGTATINSATPHSGTKCFLVSITGAQYLRYTLLTPIMGADIIEFSFWYLPDLGSAYQADLIIHYTDSTQDTVHFVLGSADWHQNDFLAEIDVSRTIDYFQLTGSSEFGGTNFRVDDFILYTNDGLSQSEITNDSYPWYTLGGYYLFNTTYYYEGSQSIKCVLIDTPADNVPKVYQSVSGLESQYITSLNIRAYIYDAIDHSEGIKGYVWFSDNSLATKTISFTSNGTWQLFNFMSLINDNPSKTVVSVGFGQANMYGTIFLDDASLTSTLPFQSGMFTFTLTPSPISYDLIAITGYSFNALSNLNYIFNGYLSDNTNGTFYVDSTYAFASGNVSNGDFSFSISNRYAKGVLTDTQEQFLIQVDNNVTIRTYSVLAYWITPATTTPTTTTEETTTQAIEALPIVLIMGMFVIPATYYLGVGGFVGGFSLASIICVWSGLAPTWFIGIVILTDLVMIFFGVKRSGSEQSSSE